MGSVVVAASAAGLGLLGAIGLTIAAAVLRITDHPVPRWLVPLLIAAFGLGASVVFTVLPTGDPGQLVLFSVLALGPAVMLGQSRRLDLLGTYLVAAGLFGVAWGVLETFEVRGALAGTDSILIGIVVPAAVAGAGLAALFIGGRGGDRISPLPAAPAPNEPDPSRAVSIATAMVRELRFGPADLPNTVAVGAGFACGMLLATALGAVGIHGWVATAAGALVGVLIGTELFYHVWPRRLARAMAAHAFVGSWEAKRFVDATGSRVPTSAAAAREWLARHPESDANRWVRPELLAWSGDLDGAYDVLGRFPTGTVAERFERHAMQAYLDTVAGRTTDVAALASAAEEVGAPGTDERLRAVVTAALAEARRRLAVGEPDWVAPLVAAQERIGSRALRIHRADTWRARFTVLLISAATFIALIALLGALWV